MMTTENYNKEDDIIGVNFGNVKHSRELKNVNIVIDFDKKDNIVGIEIFDFLKAMKESQKTIDKIFREKDKPSEVLK